MRDEKEERSKQGQTNNKAKQHTYAVRNSTDHSVCPHAGWRRADMDMYTTMYVVLLYVHVHVVLLYVHVHAMYVHVVCVLQWMAGVGG